jgi:long-chain acyl-CoA synthetase
MRASNPFFVDESRPWFRPEAGWPEEVPKNREFPKLSLYELLVQAEARHSHLPAVWFLETFMTYGELLERVDAMAAGLHELGLQKGHVLGLALPSCFQYVIASYACAKLGVIVTGVNPLHKPDEVRHQLSGLPNLHLLVLDALYEPLLGGFEGRFPQGRLIVTNIADLVSLPAWKRWLGRRLKRIPTGRYPEAAIALTSLLQASRPSPEHRASADDVAAYLMTGGTTGKPKAAVLTHFNCVANAIQVSDWMTTKEPGACMVGVIPLFHCFGMSAVMNATLRSGMWMMLFPRPPEIRDLLRTICRLAPDQQTYFPGVESLFRRVAESPDIDRYPVGRKLRACISGAGPLGEAVKSHFEAVTGAPLLEGYGLTEASPVVSGGPLGPIKTTGTIGLPLPGIDWKIVDLETGLRELPPGEAGELILTGPTVMKGYLDAAEDTNSAVRTRDGVRWLYTGDVGTMDEHGRVTLSDRKKQLIKVSGYSVFPREIEEVISSHEGVRDVAVAGLPDRETGEAVKAWVVLEADRRGGPIADDLKEWCRERLARYKIPREIEFREELPRNNLGKLLRRQLQESDPLYR